MTDLALTEHYKGKGPDNLSGDDLCKIRQLSESFLPAHVDTFKVSRNGELVLFSASTKEGYLGGIVYKAGRLRTVLDSKWAEHVRANFDTAKTIGDIMLARAAHEAYLDFKVLSL